MHPFILASVAGLLLLVPNLATADVPTTDECMGEGVFCFEVLKGPRYSYRLRHDDEPILYSMYVRRLTKQGDYGTHAWNITLPTTIDIADIELVFHQLDQPNPMLKLEVNKGDETPPNLKVYQWANEEWELVAKNDRERFINGKLVREEHGIQFVTTEKTDEVIGLENKNLTISFTLTMEQVDGKASSDKIDFLTVDGHFFMKDKPEVRAYREQRRIARAKQQAATNMTIIIISVVIALIVVSAVVFAIFKCRK